MLAVDRHQGGEGRQVEEVGARLLERYDQGVFIRRCQADLGEPFVELGRVGVGHFGVERLEVHLSPTQADGEILPGGLRIGFGGSKLFRWGGRVHRSRRGGTVQLRWAVD